MSLRVFWSYAHDDRPHYEELRRAFATMERNEGLVPWYDGEILPGTAWQPQIIQAMASADMVLLVVSRHFLSSDFCMGVELRQALERQPPIPVIPVILGPCDWMNEPALSALQAVPEGGAPIRGVQGLDEARLQGVVDGVRKWVKREKMKVRAAAPAPPAATRAPVPPTLPYVCDRERQDSLLGTHVAGHLAQRPHRPFVCFIHGDAAEHTGYLDRLGTYSLPRHLRIPDEGEVNPCCSLGWPGADVPAGERLGQFRENLGSTLNCAASEVMDELKRYGRPVLVYSELFSDEWPADGDAFLRAYLEFWNTFPPLIPGSGPLVACTLLRYRGGADAAPVRSIQAALKGVEAGLDQGRYPGITGIVLPELGPVPRMDVRGLAGKPIVQRFCRLDRYREEWIAAVDEIYGDRGELSMKDLDGHLRQLFERFAERG